MAVLSDVTVVAGVIDCGTAKEEGAAVELNDDPVGEGSTDGPENGSCSATRMVLGTDFNVGAIGFGAITGSGCGIFNCTGDDGNAATIG